MSAAPQLGQAVMEFDADATVETVVINEGDQVILEVEVLEETRTVEISETVSVAIEEVTPESDENSDKAK
jgi:segregation and condensation protein B